MRKVCLPSFVCRCSVDRHPVSPAQTATGETLMLDLPRSSQHAVVMQRIGITDITSQLSPAAGQRPPDLGQGRSLWPGMARRSQRKYHHHLQRSRHH